MSAYDAAAPTFERYRALPDGVPEEVRAAIRDAIGASPRSRFLDLGAGSGRIGRAFVAARDDYVGVDLSRGMLHEFTQRAEAVGWLPRLAQADGQCLPFADASFDAVLLIQFFGGGRGWRPVLAEARRVLRSSGALVIGRSVMPPEGVDAQMKHRLASVLGELGVQPDERTAREDVQRWLESRAAGGQRLIAAAWSADRTPRGFLDRHPTGVRFSALPEPLREEALRRQRRWAATEFGSLDAVSLERHSLELQVFTFPDEEAR
jgi:SAM-dependent methyltransferase